MKRIRISIPRSVGGMRNFLDAICKRCSDQDHDPGPEVKYLLSRIDAFNPRFKQAIAEYKKRHGERAEHLRQHRDILEELKASIQDFWRGVKRRIRRGRYAKHLLVLYRLPQLAGKPFNPQSPEDVKNAALDLIEGDAQVVARGFEAMIEPGVSELQDLIELLDIASLDSSADLNLSKAQKKLNAAQDEAYSLCRLLSHSLQIRFAKESKSNMRRIMRNYGFVFLNLDAEDDLLDEEDDLIDDNPQDDSPDPAPAEDGVSLDELGLDQLVEEPQPISDPQVAIS